jgi:glycosyltransferase involved in cell wall biosynthesis
MARKMACMKVCLICGEIFAWGKYGGFGRATRTIGRELAKRGIEVFAVVPRRGGQGARETLDGITVFGFPRYDLLESFRLYRACDADIYHSQEPSLGTWLAQRARPDRKHLVTFRDTRDEQDWEIEIRLSSRSRAAARLSKLYERNPWVTRAVRRADAVYCAAECVGRKARAVYGLPSDPERLPTPVEVPANVHKAVAPTVCYVARLDRRKRPELFFDLARRFPDVRFIAAGIAQDTGWTSALESRYAGLPNVEYRGFLDQFGSDEAQQVYDRSWVLVNTAAREGLPNSFLEAAARRCAILSEVDPDGFASRFGYCAKSGDFVSGLGWLLDQDRWRGLGESGAKFVRANFEMELAMRRHLDAYSRLLMD